MQDTRGFSGILASNPDQTLLCLVPAGLYAFQTTPGLLKSTDAAFPITSSLWGVTVNFCLFVVHGAKSTESWSIINMEFT